MSAPVGSTPGAAAPGKPELISPGGCARRVENGLDVVPVRVEGERSVVMARVLGTQAGRPDVRPAVLHGGVVPALDSVRILRTEGDVRAGGHSVATGLRAHGV